MGDGELAHTKMGRWQSGLPLEGDLHSRKPCPGRQCAKVRGSELSGPSVITHLCLNLSLAAYISCLIIRDIFDEICDLADGRSYNM